MFSYRLFLHNTKNIIIKKRIGYVLNFVLIFAVSFILSYYLVSNSSKNIDKKAYGEEKTKIITEYEETIKEKDNIIEALSSEIDSLKSSEENTTEE